MGANMQMSVFRDVGPPMINIDPRPPPAPFLLNVKSLRFDTDPNASSLL